MDNAIRFRRTLRTVCDAGRTDACNGFATLSTPCRARGTVRATLWLVRRAPVFARATAAVLHVWLGRCRGGCSVHLLDAARLVARLAALLAFCRNENRFLCSTPVAKMRTILP